MLRSYNYRWYGLWTILPVFFWLLFSLPGKAQAQTCAGSLGDPVVRIDFGRGTSFFGPPLGSNTNYSYVASGQPSDGFYTIEKSVNSGGAWYLLPNHTPDDPDGYLMMINASHSPGIFYETEVATDLCPNTTYEFAAWVSNLLSFPGIKPNLTFKVLAMDDRELSTYSTGDIVESFGPTWNQYGFLFATTGNVTRVKIRIINNAPGGTGNDLALDDITFRPCGPKISAVIDDVDGQTAKTVCENDDRSIELSAIVEGSASLRHQWQKKTGDNWTDLPGEGTTRLRLPSAAVLGIGDHQYRLTAAEAGNFDNPACRTASTALNIEVKPALMPVVVADLVVCVGSAIHLDVSGAEGTYFWSGPDGFNSTEKSPVIENVDLSNGGVYTVRVSSGTCASSASAAVEVKQAVVVTVSSDVTICEGTSVMLRASGGMIYKWAPAAGLSDPDSSSPLATPDQTTVYKVRVSNAGCYNTDSVRVSVIRKIIVDAGKRKVIIEGQSVTLDGTVRGDQFRYFWTPADYLDDPGKLNPTATPPKDMTYILNAWSERNCAGSTSSVFVKVYPKLEIPNTFSPNGDGVNDIWNIEALQAYPEATVGIYNRYGEKVFSSTDDVKSWDGRYRGKQVPAGVYYYIINLHNGQKAVSGSVMILH